MVIIIYAAAILISTYVLIWFIRTAIDSSRMASDINEIKQMLQNLQPTVIEDEPQIDPAQYGANVHLEECPACGRKVLSIDKECSSCGLRLIDE